MKHPSLKLLLVALSLALSSCASIRPHQLTRSERSERASRLFDQLDTNHDGRLSRSELAAGLKYAGAPEMNPNLVMGLENTPKKDKVHASRKLTNAEINKAMKEAFNADDKDLDHRLTKDEFKKLVVDSHSDEGDDPWEPLLDY